MIGPADSADPSAVPHYLAVGMTDVPPHDRWLTAPEAERLAGLIYAKRRLEARLGRWTAKQAVAQVLQATGWSGGLDELVIRNAADGAPEVFCDDAPAPLHISMTDRADWAVCVVVSAGPQGAGVGCDLELVEPRSGRFVADWFTPAEQSIVAAGDDTDLLANLIWSAKESALKVLRTGLRRDTRSVEVELLADRADGWNAMQVHAVEGGVFPGWWRRTGSFVLTFAGAQEMPPPRSIVQPCPLDTAEPAHSWMAAPLATNDVGAGSTD